MSKQTINIGASPNDGTGTPLRTSFDYTNQNFTEIYTALGGGVALPGATTQVIFNDGGTNLAGDAGLVYNKTTDALTVAGLVTAGSATITGDLTVQTNALFVNSANNNVGLGTLTPGSRLDVRFATNPAINNAVPTNALRVFTSVAQAVDVGGQIGLGGLYNATDFQAFGNISGKKENSTSGNNAGYLVVGTCDSGGTMTERARFNSTGAFVLNGGTTGANGIGIAFPATQVASSDANCLDDYEEGTFTPTVVGTTVAGVGVYTAQVGRYTKVGNLVSVQVYITWSAHTGTGNLSFAGLPFNLSSDLNYYSAATFGLINDLTLTAGNVLTGFATNGGSSISAYQYPTGGGSTSAVAMDAAAGIIYTMTYKV